MPPVQSLVRLRADDRVVLRGAVPGHLPPPVRVVSPGPAQDRHRLNLLLGRSSSCGPSLLPIGQVYITIISLADSYNTLFIDRINYVDYPWQSGKWVEDSAFCAMLDDNIQPKVSRRFCEFVMGTNKTNKTLLDP